MKRITLTLLALLVVGWAVNIQPEMDPYRVPELSDTTIPPDDTIYGSWQPGPGRMSDGVAFWSYAGDGSGSIDSLLVMFRRCFETIKGGMQLEYPDTAWATAWDTITVAVDSAGYYHLDNTSTDGWVECPWLQSALANIYDTDTCTVNGFGYYMSGSE